jgi:hypothetical protein
VDLCADALVLFLAVWFALSVVNQIPWKRFRAAQRADALQLLPLWTFFAPNPGVQDYYLLYRDRTGTDTLGDWQLLQPGQSRRWTSCIWNPDKIENKVLSDLVQMFTDYQEHGVKDGAAIMLSLPYLVWLKMAIDAPGGRAGTLRQFLLVQRQGLTPADPFSPILVSDFHPCE